LARNTEKTPRSGGRIDQRIERSPTEALVKYRMHTRVRDYLSYDRYQNGPKKGGFAGDIATHGLKLYFC
jgi:hypothetical protein